MDRLRREKRETNPENGPSFRPHRSPSEPPPTPKTHLPLRWAVILLATAGSAFPVAAAAGTVAAVSVAVAMAALMHKILP